MVLYNIFNIRLTIYVFYITRKYRIYRNSLILYEYTIVLTHYIHVCHGFSSGAQRQFDELIPVLSIIPFTFSYNFRLIPGEVIRWEQQVRFRHMTTKRYLCMNSDMQVSLTIQHKDPHAVFRLHPVKKVQTYSSYLMNYWNIVK